MTKQLTDYTQKELEDKILNIKAEREKTENALRKYEEELERRKHEPVLGVPLKGTLNEMPYEVFSRGFLEWFLSEESADKFADYFYSFEEALQDIAEGKPIDIKVLLPLLRKGYVAMDENERWYWFKHKPTRTNTVWTTTEDEGLSHLSNAFNLKPAKDWKNSLMECGL